jgi:hypothetical protein
VHHAPRIEERDIMDGPVGKGADRAVALVRYRPAARTTEGEAHLVPLPLRDDDSRRATISTLCGRRLHLEHVEKIRTGQGLRCSPCFAAHAAHVAGVPTAPSTDRTTTPDPSEIPEIDTVAGRRAAGAAYQRLGWPVTLRSREVILHLDLDIDAVALMVPARLGIAVAGVLTRRRGMPAVLVHPAVPTHWIFLAGERSPRPPTWPTEVHRITGTLLLPPTATTHGPVCWVCPPQPGILRLCREADVIAALRTALGTGTDS